MSDSPTDSTPALKAQIEALLAAEQPKSSLVRALTALAEQQPVAFRKLADVWALRLYERSANYFNTFLLRWLGSENAPVIETLMAWAERDSHNSLFSDLYHMVGSETRWNDDILRLAASEPDNRRLSERINLRTRWGWKLREDAALALYRRGDEFKQIIQHSLADHNPGKESPYPELWRVVQASQQRDDVYRTLIQRYGSEADWHAEIHRVLALQEGKPRQLLSEIVQLRPSHLHDLPPDLIDALRQRFGKEAEPFLAQNVRSVSREIIKSRFEAALKLPAVDDIARAIGRIRDHVGWPEYQANSDLWVPMLYPYRELEQEIQNAMHYMTPRAKLALMGRALRDGRYSLFRSVFQNIGTNPEWNAEVLKLAQADLTDTALDRELERLDIPYKFALFDESAAALYRRSQGRHMEFILDHLSNSRGSYPQLLQAVRELGSAQESQRLFRRVASGADWQAQMERVLAADIPADHILEELNRWHPHGTDGTNPTILTRFLEKYGEAVLPYLERTLNWASPSRLRRLLALNIDRAVLLRELAAIAGRQPVEFSTQAPIWAPVLYERGPEFFGAFLARYLGPQQEYVIRELLPRIEQDGRDKLYRDLYARYINDEEWKAEIHDLIGLTSSDEALLKALNLRDVGGLILNEKDAIALYQRNADLFRPFIKAHTGRAWRSWRRWWDSDANRFKRLYELAQKRGDQDLSAHLLVENTDKRDHKHEIEALLNKPIAQDEIVPALTRLEVTDTDVLIRFIEVYGAVVLPYLWKHLSWLANPKKLLKAVDDLNDESLYWQTFFRLNLVKEWNEVLFRLAREAVDENEFFGDLAPMTPGGDVTGWQRGRWQVHTSVAKEMYPRFGAKVRPFLESFLAEPDLEFFQMVNRQRDEDFADFLTFRLLGVVTQKLNTQRGWGRRRTESVKPDRETQATIDALIARLERLYAQSPDGYVLHAANILAHYRPFEINRWNDPRGINPVYDYLTQQHHADWVRSRKAITELIESPSIFVQLVGLEILSKGGPDAAARVVENLPPLRAFLLGRGRRNTKRQVLRALELAAGQGSAYAVRILPALDDLMDFRSRRSIAEDVMATYVRLKHAVGVG